MCLDQQLREALKWVAEVTMTNTEERQGLTLREIFKGLKGPGVGVLLDTWTNDELASVYAGRGLWIH